MFGRSAAVARVVAAAAALAAVAAGTPGAAGELGEWVKKEVDAPLHDPATSSWARRGRAEAARPIALTVALRVDHDRREALERVLFEVSDPDHPNYGRFLGLDDVTALLRVPAARADAVRAYFAARGATEVRAAPNGDMLTVTMPVAAAEAALNTAIHVFEHKERPATRVLRAVRHYSLPAEIAQHVSMVGELLQFPKLLPKPSPSNSLGRGAWPNDCNATGCEGLVTPGVIAKAYKLPNVSSSLAAEVKGNSMAVAEFQGQYYSPDDLSTFSQACHRDVKVDVTVGGNEPHGEVESELDIEYIKSVAPEVPLTAIYQEEYSLLSWANKINSMSDAPLVHSVSYGNDEMQQSSFEYMQTCNTAFMKAGVRGLSILFASGDQGVCGRDGCGEGARLRFKPDFPAASPYITAVGGTDFEGAGIGPESAWNNGGGGFSDHFAAPAYQKDAVAQYLRSPDLPPQAMWNASGRGYPDIAALGGEKTPYCVFVKNEMEFQGVSGTSASAPVVAGVFAKLNGLRLAKGMPPLGFLNPFIYKNPSGFQDVMSGKNDADTGYGFKAVKGWDAATGFGSPNYEVLSRLVMASARADAPSLVV